MPGAWYQGKREFTNVTFGQSLLICGFVLSATVILIPIGVPLMIVGSLIEFGPCECCKFIFNGISCLFTDCCCRKTDE